LHYKKKKGFYINSDEPLIHSTPAITGPLLQTFQEMIIHTRGKTSNKKELAAFQACPFSSALDVAALPSRSNIPSTTAPEDVPSRPPEQLLDSDLKPAFR
jgi:hypothetical protein